MVTSVSSLLKTVKNVEDEAGKGVRTLENAIERISSEIAVCYFGFCSVFSGIYNLIFSTCRITNLPKLLRFLLHLKN